MITVVGIRLIHTHTHGYHACREASTTRVESLFVVVELVDVVMVVTPEIVHVGFLL